MDREASRASQHLAETDVHAHEVLMLFNCLLQEVVAQESERCQYVCPSLNCLVLGDSQVGKTSLVRSLTGERLDTEQTKTQGIEERIVDNEWNTVEFTKGHAIGKFIPYFQEILARSMSFGRDIIVPLSDETKLDCTALLRVITLYALRIKELVTVIVCAAIHLHLVLQFMWTTIVFTEGSLPFALEVQQLLLSVFSIFFLIKLAVSMRCFLKGIPLFGLIAGVFLAVMMTCNSIEIFESQQFLKIIIYSALVTQTMLLGVVELHLLFKFTVKWFQNHIQGTSPHPGQDKFEFGTIRRPQEKLSSMVLGFTGFSIIMTLSVLLPMAKNPQLTHAHQHIALVSVFCLLVFLSAQSTRHRVAGKILKIHWSWKALIVFMTIPILFISTRLYYTVISCLLSGSIVILEYHFAFWYKFTPGVADVNSNVVQLMNTSCDAFSYTALLFWEKLKLKAYRKGKFLNFKLLDFVGDREYYSYHHLFFGPEALYIIAFNLSEFANEYFRGVCTQIQRLQFWMKCICSRVPHYTQIVLVGTHRENLNDSCIKILNDHLKKFLSEKYCAKVMENDVDRLIFFPVGNTSGNKDNGIKELQSKIMCVASEQQKRIIIEHNIPLQWILIQDVIMELKVNSDDTFCVTVDELQRIIMEDFVLHDKCRLSKDMLKYFHKIGLIIYVDRRQDFDLSNWILVCPEKLIDIFINISSKPAESTKYRGSLKYDWKLLQRKGILTKQLLQSLLSTVEEEEEAVIAFLEHYGLICPMEYKEIAGSTKCDCDIQPTHFVPSLLPLSANGDTPVWHNNDGDKKFYVFFCNFLPEALFHQLLSRAQKNSTLEFPNGKTVLYRDAGKFWMNPWLSYQLTLIEEEEMIEVTYNSSHRNKKEPSDVLCQVFSMIDGICKSYFPLVKFHCGPACPSDTCPGHQDDYFTSLPAEEGNGTRRRHVYNIMPGRQGNRAAYLYCENNCLEDELYEWIP
ncbi:PREDICTED: uncharacterized protein LOC107344872 isoform X1 [Acropora digitifera]|uniref:uncharacterized protein LOC107344872 isoform X1 n=1 Tax=Acropora digitifera TaxID=70779 RepID=UPI00077B19B8|nr:PREDICTED: uncharacterized protein LOC107344872 isoform X1 [Acropora digitifera]